MKSFSMFRCTGFVHWFHSLSLLHRLSPCVRCRCQRPGRSSGLPWWTDNKVRAACRFLDMLATAESALAQGSVPQQARWSQSIVRRPPDQPVGRTDQELSKLFTKATWRYLQIWGGCLGWSRPMSSVLGWSSSWLLPLIASANRSITSVSHIGQGMALLGLSTWVSSRSRSHKPGL